MDGLALYRCDRKRSAERGEGEYEMDGQMQSEGSAWQSDGREGAWAYERVDVR